MAADKKGFILYADQIDIFNELPDEMAGKLVKHIYRYVNDEDPKTDDLVIRIAFAPIKAQLKRDLQKWDAKSSKNRDNAMMRWNKTHANNANACERIPTHANDAVNDNVNDNVNVTVNDTDTLNGFDEDEFTRFINRYGKKTDLMDAKNEFINLLPTDKKRVWDHMPLFIANHKENGKMQFLPKFCNYLNKRKWEEDMPYHLENQRSKLLA